MRFYNLLNALILVVLAYSCGDKKNDDKAPFNLRIEGASEKIQQGETAKVQLHPKGEQNIDSVIYSFAGEEIQVKNNSYTFKLPLGENTFTAKVYSDGEEYKIEEQVVVHSNKKTKFYTYEIVNTYPHDKDAFTQGLEFYKDTLYESTGLNGKSTIRKVDYTTGEVLQKVKLSDVYFGEGLTILNDKLYQLTWRSGDGLIYDVNTFERLETFKYNSSKEGWGLCNNGEKIYKSDGTQKIWILNPETLEEESYIQPVTHKSTITKLNELEWVEGKIYANTWQKDGVVIIDPETGAVEGLIDFRGLREKVTQHKKLDVLNGIAYNPNTQKLYVTGKNWDKLFEVKIVEK